MIGTENICEILDENHVRYAADLLSRGKSPTTAEAQRITDDCLEILADYIVYGLNNGFERVAKEIGALTQAAVELSAPTLKPRAQNSLKKQVEKSRENAKKEFVRDAVSFPDGYVLGISRALLPYIADTRRCISSYRKEIADMSEGEFGELTSTAGIPFPSYTEWRERADAVLTEADGLLGEIASDLSDVFDDSSVLSLGQANAVADRILHWRNDVAYSYLLLHSGMNENLRAAEELSRRWKERLKGVGKGNPRAESAGSYPVNDQMGEYVSALARQAK